MSQDLIIAVEGCLHGELDAVYAAIQEAELVSSRKVDLLLVCGDFESLVEESDMECMAVPNKYRKMNEFRDYASGVKHAYCPTIFVGGNHEASNKLQALYYGGFVAPDIYFLGFAGCVNFKGLRIAGVSGIYNRGHYHKGHYEKPPYTADQLRSVYHTREQDIIRLAKLQGSVDIMMSHDWPNEVWNYGDADRLLRAKPFFREDMMSGKLGSPPLAQLMGTMRPNYWFSAHLHTKFAAVVPWTEVQATIGTGMSSSLCAPCAPTSCTRFLALDKVIPGREFLQLLTISVPNAATASCSGNNEGEEGERGDREDRDRDWLEYDLEWLCILIRTHHLLGPSVTPHTINTARQWNGCIEPEELDRVRDLVLAASRESSSSSSSSSSGGRETEQGGQGSLRIPNIEPIPLNMTGTRSSRAQQQGNKQTDYFLSMLGLPHLWTVPSSFEPAKAPAPPPPPPPPPPPLHPSPPPFPPSLLVIESNARDNAEIDIDEL